jgi:hypothetical protein
MGFLTGYVLPKAYYEEGRAGRVRGRADRHRPLHGRASFERNAFMRLKANPELLGRCKPAYETVTHEIRDRRRRAAWPRWNRAPAHVTLEIPYEEYRPAEREGQGIVGHRRSRSPISRMIFINDVDPMLDKNVRLADASRDRQAGSSSTGCSRATALPIDTLQTPDYAAYDADDHRGLRPRKGGKGTPRRLRLLGPDNPVKLQDPDDPRLQAEGLRDHPGHRRALAAGRHRGRDRGLRDRQAFRAARRGPAGAGRLLQLGQLGGRSGDLDRLCHVRPLAALGVGRLRR